MNLSPREQLVLTAIIEEYIETSRPIGSRFISKLPGIGWSPATIRNVMSDLEEQGFLIHPHTSAGRIPTEAGLRFYVDKLIRVRPISAEKQIELHDLFRKIILQEKEIFRGTIRFLSELAKQASIGFVQPASSSFDGGDIFIDGRTHLIDHFELNQASQLKPFLQILEDHRSLRPLLLQASQTDRTQVMFSSEMAALPLPPCSLVASPVQLKDGRLGALMVLGNLRLKYEEVISLVDYTSSLLSHLGKRDLLR